MLFVEIYTAIWNAKLSIVSKQFTLGKNERLKSRKQIEHLFNDGQRFNFSFFRIFYSISGNSDANKPSLQAGFAAGSRNFKTAVDRNRIKRLVREAWRLQKNDLKKSFRNKKGKWMFFLFIPGRNCLCILKFPLQLKKLLKKFMP